MITPRIMVGYDGSPESRLAAHWGAAEAARVDATLHLINVYDAAGVATFYEEPGVPPQVGVAERAEQLLEDMRVELRAGHPHVEVVAAAVPGEPACTLLDLSVDARSLVVGTRGSGGFAGLLLGSVSQQIATHATVPVTVVRGRPAPLTGPVLVGVDGSAAADLALDLAFETAAARCSTLLAVRAFVPPTPPGQAGHTQILIPKDVVAADERAALETALAPWREKYPSVPVDAQVVEGKAARVLVERSATAQLVVVGSRGHGGFVGLLLGSVGQQLVHHAGCPVTVVHRRA